MTRAPLRARARRSAIHLALACLALVLSACGTVDDVSPTGRAPASPHASAVASHVPTADASPQDVYVNQVHGWSIVVPPGWEVMENGIGDTALTRDQVIVEILVLPATGLSLEELGAQRAEELGEWPGAGSVETELVRLPAGQAVRNTMEMVHPNGELGIFVAYLIQEGERQYVISTRGPLDDGALVADAEALAESFAIND